MRYPLSMYNIVRQNLFAMHQINIIIGNDPPFSYGVDSTDTVKELRKQLYAIDHRVLVNAMPVVKTFSNETKVISEKAYESESVVDVLNRQDGIAIEFPTQQPPLNVPWVGSRNPFIMGEPLPVSGQHLIGDLRPGQRVHYTTPTRINERRLTDLAMKQLNQLLLLNKIGYGRIVDENSKVQSCSREVFRYTFSEKDQTKQLLEDINNSYVRRVDNLSQLEKELVKEGIKPVEISLKIPFINALSYQHQNKATHSITENSKKKYMCMTHYFPVGQLRLDLVDVNNEKVVNHNLSFQSYFDDQSNYSCKGIQRFYRTYGQYFMKRVVLGLKHVAERSEDSNIVNDRSTTEKKIGGKISAQIKGIGFSFGTSKQDKTSDNKKSTTDNQVDEVTIFGGTNLQLYDVGKFAESISKWRLWRIIEVKDYQPIDHFLPQTVRKRIRFQLAKFAYMYQLWIGERMFRELGVLDSPPIQREEWSPSKVVSLFNPEIFQLVPVLGQYLLLVQEKRIHRLKVFPQLEMDQLPVNNVLCKLSQMEKVIGCAVDQASNLIYIVQQNRIHVFTLPSFTLPSFTQKSPSVRISIPNTPIYRYDCSVQEGMLLGCGKQGLYCLDVLTGMHMLVAFGDYSKCEIVRMQNRVYLFGKNVTCIDLASRCSAVIEGHQWNSGQPTTNGFQVWKCSNGKLFRIRGGEVVQITFHNGTISTNKFAITASVCFMKGSLYLPDQNAHYLIQYPLEEAETMEQVKGEIAKRHGYGQFSQPGSVSGSVLYRQAYVQDKPSQNLQRIAIEPSRKSYFQYQSKQILSPRTKSTFDSSAFFEN